MAVQANPYAGYQLVIAVDISGSMNTKERAYDNQTRFQFVQQQIGHLAKELAEFDEDGIDLVIFNNNVQVKRGVDSSEAVQRIFDGMRASGSTDTTGAVSECFKLYEIHKQDREFKATIVLVITDGVPNDPNSLRNKLLEISKKVKTQAEIGFTFLQVGDDSEARGYLKGLDDMKVEKDIVDSKSFDELCEGGKLSLAKVLADSLND